VVVVAPPWNFPFAIAMGGVLAALAAGNGVVLKPAPQTVLTAQLVAQCCWEAGVPDNALAFVVCPDDEVGQALITHPDVSAVILTGGLSTADLFHGWKPSMKLLAETSGKNAIVITGAADVELAVKDLVRSAFGHAGQKCSAASLAIVETSVYDDPAFRARLNDATTSLRVGPAFDLATDVGPLVEEPSDKLLRALTVLDLGESWLVQPRHLGGTMWTPGIRLGVTAGSWFHRTECFGPVLGVMRADDLEQALVMQNATDFGLTAGLHSLNEGEIERWLDQVQAGNLYVNRSITGAVVQRQPFGGWKRSTVGPTAKAGGPRYVASLASLRAEPISDAAEVTSEYAQWAASEMLVEHDPSALRCESNVLRFRKLPRGVVVRIGEDTDDGAVLLASAAASMTNCNVHISRASEETDAVFAERMVTLSVDRLRVFGTVSHEVQREAHRLGLVVDDAPISADPANELPRWLREQSVTVTRHRHGHIPT
jgi:RHH-type transcriptional regulator, proline utilization regulon repressor / proline dehydrogenase / delta 1-pyrroline-5-carboxylate dehydrogenase